LECDIYYPRYTVTQWLNAGIVELKRWLRNGAANICNEHATIQEMKEVLFSIWSMPRLHTKDPAAAQSVEFRGPELGGNWSWSCRGFSWRQLQ
jgi:hypothetical protein